MEHSTNPIKETPEEEARRIAKEQFIHSNFRSEFSDYEKRVAHIPKRLWTAGKQDILPTHVEIIQNYVLSWTVGESRKNPSDGMILFGEFELCMKYMAVILERVYLRRRTVYCESVFNLEKECWNQERLLELSEKVSLLGVYGFPFFINGLQKEKPELMMTPFHQMIFNRSNNCLPIIFVCDGHADRMGEAYKLFPGYMQNAMASNTITEVRGGA
jgi:hypothetical protein